MYHRLLNINLCVTKKKKIIHPEEIEVFALELFSECSIFFEI